MIDDGILFSYGSSGEYMASVQRVRDRLCAFRGRYYIPVDRCTGNLRRFAVAIFDETGAADIDVCLMGNTLYILAMRLAEHKWFVTANQAVEFGACGTSIAATLPFEGGYGALGIIGAAGLGPFTRDQASIHCAAMKNYMLAGGRPSALQESACKLAFAFFAMTIAEAARFPGLADAVCRGGIDPAGTIPLLQSWVIHSSVRDDQFPSHEIAIAGVHEQRSGKVWKELVRNLNDHPELCPSIADLAGDSAATAAFLRKEGLFSAVEKKPGGSAKTGYESGREFLLDAFFRDRVRPGLLVAARQKFTELAQGGVAVKPIQLAGLNI